ncbi:hypothetical protein LTR08_008233 [Meristemomyces frigidus]|nr:hypothetical protein LTR08_008233 [Meristemomyces frigidus]
MAGDPRGDAAKAVKITGDTVTLVVGSEAAIIFVHEQTIRARSHFFDAALDKRWKEAMDRRIELPDDKADIVQLYCQYLYSEKIYLTPTLLKTDVVEGTEILPEYIKLAELYVFGEKVLDALLKNTVMDAFLYRMNEKVENTFYCPCTTVIDTIYQGTMPGSPARQMVLDIHICDGRASWVTLKPEENNKDFLIDLARALLGMARTPKVHMPDMSDIGKGTYHEAVDGKNKRRRGE